MKNDIFSKCCYCFEIFIIIAIAYGCLLFEVCSILNNINVEVLAIILISFNATLFLIMWFLLRINDCNKSINEKNTSEKTDSNEDKK